jgi:hypothetical protein
MMIDEPKELTLAEQTRRDTLENEFVANVAAGCASYMDAGRCLAEILDGKLYRDEYDNFDTYAEEFWGMGATKARRWADAWRVMANLQAAKEEMPLLYWDAMEGFCESHARVLGKLPADQQAAAWSVAKSIDDSPTAKVLNQVVDQFTAKFQTIDDMTQPEELSLLQQVEAATSSAYWGAKRAERCRSLAKFLSKELKSWNDNLDLPELRDAIQAVLDMLPADGGRTQAAEMMSA